MYEEDFTISERDGFICNSRPYSGKCDPRHFYKVSQKEREWRITCVRKGVVREGVPFGA